MPKYIDAERFERVLMGLGEDVICDDCCLEVLNRMDEIPAADVEPVRHGRWKFDPLAGDWICSECDLHSMEHGRFCPNCGAKNKEG